MLGCLPTLAFGAVPKGCTGSASLGTVRIAVRRSVGASLPVKSASVIPAGAHLIWDPAHLSPGFSSKSEVTAILAHAEGGIIVLPPQNADAHAEWNLPVSPSVLALVIGPQGLNMSKVTSLVKRNQDLLAQLADYAEQTSEVEALVQQLADSEDSGRSTDAALKGFSSQYGVAVPKLDTKAPSDQQASLLLHAVLPSANSYDPLAPATMQMQQSVGLAASVAGLFFGNGVGLAAGGTALIANLKMTLFPSTELRSAFAQTADKDNLALCSKSVAPKSRTRIAYLWAYRVPDQKPPVAAIVGPAHLPLAGASTVAFAGQVKELERARDWQLVPISGGAAVPVTVAAGAVPDSIKIDLSNSKATPGEYRLTAAWDWDSLNLGKIQLHPLADFRRVQIAPESRDKLVEGSGMVSVKLTGADFEFVEKASIQKALANPKALSKAAPPVPVDFELPAGKRAGEETSMEVEIDTAAHGLYKLLLAQSDGKTHEVPVTILPPNPKLSNLPVRVNAGEAEEAIRFEGSGLEQIESVTCDAGLITGQANGKGWAGAIRPKAGLRPGDSFPLILKVRGLDETLTVPDAIEAVGPRPKITAVRRSMPGNPGIELQQDELPAGTTIGMVIEVSGLHEDARPVLELGCHPGEQKRLLQLSPDVSADGASLSFAGPGALYLSLDANAVGYAGCGLTAHLRTQPEGRSDPMRLGRVVRVPLLEQFTLTAEPAGPSAYAGVLKGRDLDLVERTGWDQQNGLAVDAIPTPVPGEPGKQTLRICLPWPSPSPHAALYVWLRGEKDARRTAVTY